MEQTSPVKLKSLDQKITGLLEKYPVILQFLKFVSIGFLTTAVDFLILNFISKYLNVNFGFRLGGVNALSFAVALIHSYIWNANWTFDFKALRLSGKVFWQTVGLGAIGATAVFLSLFGGKIQASAFYYLVVLFFLFLFELIVWKSLKLGWFENRQNVVIQTVAGFVLVSFFGALINSGAVSFLTQFWAFTDNADLNKNLAKFIATLFSLVWNFVGYKIFVFKKQE